MSRRLWQLIVPIIAAVVFAIFLRLISRIFTGQISSFC